MRIYLSTKKPPVQSRTEGFIINLAATYSPTQLPMQYHRRSGA